MANIDQEINKTVDGAVQEVSKTVDEKLKEADKAIDEKRDEVLHQIQEKATVASQSAGDSVGSVLGKAKGLLKF
ncbi:hypothetical protein GN156_31465 [bacterium LRH843]|nr:hypothetical protein [bacterium LRH843]